MIVNKIKEADSPVLGQRQDQADAYIDGFCHALGMEPNKKDKKAISACLFPETVWCEVFLGKQHATNCIICGDGKVYFRNRKGKEEIPAEQAAVIIKENISCKHCPRKGRCGKELDIYGKIQILDF